MKKKIKLILKIIIIILAIYLLCFAGYFGNKLAKYNKLVNSKKEALGGESFKIVRKAERLIEEGPATTQIGFVKGNKTRFEIISEYTDDAIANSNGLIKNYHGIMYFEKDNNSSSMYGSHQVFVNEDEKYFVLTENMLATDMMVTGLYPNANEFSYLGGYEMNLREKYYYYSSLFPWIVSMKFYDEEDNGKIVFIAESDRSSFSGSGDDREYNRVKTYYDKDTMIPYKQVKVKPDGTEKLLYTFEFFKDTVTDEEVNVPDLSNYRQMLEI